MRLPRRLTVAHILLDALVLGSGTPENGHCSDWLLIRHKERLSKATCHRARTLTKVPIWPIAHFLIGKNDLPEDFVTFSHWGLSEVTEGSKVRARRPFFPLAAGPRLHEHYTQRSGPRDTTHTHTEHLPLAPVCPQLRHIKDELAGVLCPVRMHAISLT